MLQLLHFKPTGFASVGLFLGSQSTKATQILRHTNESLNADNFSLGTVGASRINNALCNNLLVTQNYNGQAYTYLLDQRYPRGLTLLLNISILSQQGNIRFEGGYICSASEYVGTSTNWRSSCTIMYASVRLSEDQDSKVFTMIANLGSNSFTNFGKACN